MKVVHLITGLDSGGAERMLVRLATTGHRDGFDHVVVSMMDEGAYGAELRAANVPLYCLGMERGRPTLSGLARLVGLLRGQRPDVLQTWLYHADLMGLVAGWLAGVPRLAWNIRCSDMEMTNYSRLSALVLKLLAHCSGRPDVVLVNSEAGRARHEELGYRPRRWRVIPNGFDLGRFRPDPEVPARLRAALGLPQEAVIVGHVARFDPMKDHLGFLGAFGSIKDPCPNLFVVMVGPGVTTENPLLAEAMVSQGLNGRVFMLGERRDVPALMAGFDFLVLSSAFGEGFPNVLGEAMACGLPSIATDVGDCAAILGDTGRIVPRRDSSALAGAIRDMFALGADVRRSLGAQARARVEANYALPAVLAAYHDEYRRLTG